MTGDLWEVRPLAGGLALELHGGEVPALVLTQGGQAIRVELRHVIDLVAALTNAGGDLAGLLVGEGGYHA